MKGMAQPAEMLTNTNMQSGGPELTECIRDWCRHGVYDSDDCQRNGEDEGWYGPEDALIVEHRSEAWACIVSRSKCFPIWPTGVRVDSDCVFNKIVNGRLNRLPFGCRRESKRCHPALAVVQRGTTSQYGQAVQQGRHGHAQYSQPNNVRRGSNDEEGGDYSYCNRRSPIQIVETPPVVRPKRPIETFLFHELNRPYAEFQIGRTAPDGCDDGKGDPTLNVSTVSEAIVEGNRHNASVNPHNEYQENKLPSLLATVPGEGQLR